MQWYYLLYLPLLEIFIFSPGFKLLSSNFISSLELSFNISFRVVLLATDFFSSFLYGKVLIFSSIFKGSFYPIQNSSSTVFSFQHFKYIIYLYHCPLDSLVSEDKLLILLRTPVCDKSPLSCFFQDSLFVIGL